MRKVINSILILIIILGIFFPETKTRAATCPAGQISSGTNCVIPALKINLAFLTGYVTGKDYPITVATNPLQQYKTISFSGGSGVTFTSNDPVNYQCQTKATGTCTVNMKFVTAGTYSITVSSPGYENVTSSVLTAEKYDPLGTCVHDGTIMETKESGCIGAFTPYPGGVKPLVCSIDSAKFTPSGPQSGSWFLDATPPSVRIDVVGKNCAGKTVEISIVEDDTLTPDDDIAELNNKSVTFSDTNIFSISLTAGETECSQEPGVANDCEYYIKIYQLPGGDFVSDGSPDGNLKYECDGVCANGWRVGGVVLTPGSPLTPTDPGFSTYTLLEPIGTMGPTFDAGNTNALGNYLNIMIRLFIGICAILAMIMIVLGGIEYMTSELPSMKESGKERISNAIFGLLLALGSYALLNTINPDLLIVDTQIPNATLIVMGPDTGDDTVDPEYAKAIYSSSTAESAGTTAVVAKLRQGWSISQFHVFRNNRMGIILSNGTTTDASNVISIAPGTGGYASAGTAKGGDKKTPSGSWKIIDIRYSPGKAQFSQTKSNLGAAFWLLDPMVSGERGIGMHGSKTGALGATNGCIRLTNADLLALQPYIKKGIPVFVD